MNKGNADRFSFLAIACLPVIFLFPTLAVVRLAQSYSSRFLWGYVALISTVTYCFYWRDKRKSMAGEWRIPEETLHFLELMGGWPGAIFAQRILRHKCSKTSYQIKFWAIVALHEFAAFDFTQGWAWTKGALRFLL